mmetsp:Transcript_89617/g.252630  ORF Transcript_89617/g.252630 Transcript_89617/m.252630 type:complete len:266 (+) Transcript_89617:1432-2229(+)
MPAITAKTPALGRSWPSMVAISPPAKMVAPPGEAASTPASAWQRSCWSTNRKPCLSVFSPLSRTQDCGDPSVHQMQSSHGYDRPSAQRKTPASTPVTSQPEWNATPRSMSAFSAKALAPTVCCGSNPLLVNMTTESTAVLFASDNSRVKRACMAIANSKPPAPPPTTTIRHVPWRVGTLFTSSSHLAPKLSIGFTGVTPFASNPGSILGDEPMLMERASYAIGGRPPLTTTRRFSRSRPSAVARTSLTPAKRANRLRSMWHSRRV